MLLRSGQALQGVAAAARPSPLSARLAAAVADQDRLLDVIADGRATLGFDPALRFSGLLEDLPPDLVDDLLVVLREALPEVAEHAGASTVEVEVHVDAGQVMLRVTDDSSDDEGAPRRSVLAELRRRAEDRGGELDVSGDRSGGTQLSWSVPVS